MITIRSSRVGNEGVYFSEYNREFVIAWLSSTDQTKLYFPLEDVAYVNKSIAAFRRNYPNIKSERKFPFIVISKS